SALTFPHALYARQYQVQPYFRWQEPYPEPAYTRPELQHYWVDDQPNVGRREQADKRALCVELNKRIAEFVFFYFPMLQFGSVLFALRHLWRRRLFVVWAAALLPFFVSFVASYDFLVHYMAPLTGICLLLVVEGLRWMETLRFKTRPS